MVEDKILQKLDQHGQRFERITEKLLEHDDKFEQLGNKIDDKFVKVYDTLENITTIVKRLDQERIFTAEWVKRIEDRVEQTEKNVEEQRTDINKMKVQLNLT
jgi:translation initiation factor 2 alpha subunit (eIF-2alpha)